jgi:TfoX/Sxy family transcriptional regulator of competence genes
MPFNESLAARIRQLLVRKLGISEKKMFGGIGFLLYGNMCVGVWKEFLIVRVGTDNYDEALANPNVREFDITGKSMRGWVMVEPDGIESDNDLKKWVRFATEFVVTLPPK